MTNDERREFEAHKKRAEKQLSDMYYGKSGQNYSKNSSPTSSKGSLNPQNSSNKTEQQENAGSQKTHQIEPPKAPRNGGVSLLNMLNFKSIDMDSDRATILALCLLLSSEGADELLILALIYIML